jgi:hypothetical protein
MRLHLDALGWLHMLAGWMGVVTGASLFVLVGGTFAVAADSPMQLSGVPAFWLLLVAATFLVGGGVVMAGVGRAIVTRRPAGRTAALGLAAINLALLPFGTALAVYTFWAMLNDDARRAFGRPLRTPASA